MIKLRKLCAYLSKVLTRMYVEPVNDENTVPNSGRWDVEVGVDLRVVVDQPTPTIY